MSADALESVSSNSADTTLAVCIWHTLIIENKSWKHVINALNYTNTVVLQKLTMQYTNGNGQKSRTINKGKQTNYSAWIRSGWLFIHQVNIKCKKLPQRNKCLQKAYSSVLDVIDPILVCLEQGHSQGKVLRVLGPPQSNPTKKIMKDKTCTQYDTTHALHIRLIDLWMSWMNWELRSINCYEFVGYFWATARTLVQKSRVVMTSFIQSATDCD